MLKYFSLVFYLSLLKNIISFAIINLFSLYRTYAQQSLNLIFLNALIFDISMIKTYTFYDVYMNQLHVHPDGQPQNDLDHHSHSVFFMGDDIWELISLCWLRSGAICVVLLLLQT